MNFRPVHQNLDTSFVNLSALIKYLRRRQFAGIVRVRLNNYEAEIHITDENQLKVSEQDHLSGRVSEGEEALQRILIRSREPGGIVNVFQKTTANPATEISENIDAKTSAQVSKTPQIQKQISAAPNTISVKPHIVNKPEVKPIAEKLSTEMPKKIVPETASKKIELPAPKIEIQPQTQKVSLPEFPFRLTNNVEAKAQQTKISAERFQVLVKLFAEILGTIDKSLAQANLNFAAAFEKACAEISGDYPFLKAQENIFIYKNGEIKINGQINANQFKSSLLEAVRRVLEKLGANPKFVEVFRSTNQNLLAVLRQRKALCDEFSITNKLEKMLGV